VDSGVTLTLDDATLENLNVTNGGALQIDGGDTLTLSKVSIAGGTLSIGCASVIDIENGVSTLDGVSLTNNGAVQVDAGGITATLILDDQTTIRGGLLSIGCTGMLDVETGVAGPGHGATLDGVNVTDHGGIEVGATSCGAILTLDDGTKIGGGGSLMIDAGSSLQIEGSGATLDGINVTNYGSIQVDVSNSSTKLMLDDDSAIGGGSLSIGNAGVLDVETGADGSCHGATLDGVKVTDGGRIEVGETSTDAILTVEDGTTIGGCGTMTIDAGSTLDVVNGTSTINLSGTITNNGVLEASSCATLIIASNINNACGQLDVTSGGTLEIQSKISGGGATIQGGTLHFDEESNVNVTFDNSHGYGKLVIGDADGDVDTFSGHIFGFSGTAPDASHSDVVELDDFAETHYSVQYKNGDEILTLRDAHGHVTTLTFDDFSGNLVVSSSGGKTSIYDPPAASAAGDTPSQTPAASAAADHASSVATFQNEFSKVSAGNEHAIDHSMGSSNSLPVFGEHGIVPPAINAAAGTSAVAEGDLAIESGSNGGFVQTTLSSLLSVLTSGQDAVPSAAHTFTLGGDQAITATLGTSALGGDQVTVPPMGTALGGEHATVLTMGTPSPFTSPALGADNFVFHPNLGNDNAHNSDAHAAVFAPSNVQSSAQLSELVTSAPEPAPPTMFDPTHHDVADISAMVSQFHQIASSAALLH
jgi:hypothetical protein